MVEEKNSTEFDTLIFSTHIQQKKLNKSQLTAVDARLS